jgi:hypothetical protein
LAAEQVLALAQEPQKEQVKPRLVQLSEPVRE